MSLKKRQKTDIVVSNVDAPAIDFVVKSQLQTLEKLIKKNQQLRIQYAQEPEKFMQSELDLHELIEKFHGIAATTEEFKSLIEKPSSVEVLVQLLAHENLDIAIATAALLHECLDLEATSLRDQEIIEQFFKSLDEMDFILYLVQYLQAVSSHAGDVHAAETKAVFTVFTIIENIMEIDSTIMSKLVEKTPIVSLLMAQITVAKSHSGGGQDEMNPNKLYASEILSILLQGNIELVHCITKEQFDQLLQTISIYRKRDPASSDEEEFVENIFNCVNNCLMRIEYQELFRKLEGFELLLKCIQNKKYAKECAIRSIDHAVTNSIRNCERFIDLSGLKVLFGLFMGRSGLSKRGKKAGKTKQQTEEHCISILSNLCLLCSSDTPNNGYERLHAKFYEKSFEKSDRILEMYETYQSRMRRLEDQEKQTQMDGDDEVYHFKKLDAGLYTLQRICFLIAHLVSFSKEIRSHILEKMHEQDISPEPVLSTLREYASTLGDDQDMSSSSVKQETESEKLVHAHRVHLLELAKILEAHFVSQQ